MNDLIVKRRKIANVINGEPWIYPNAIVSEQVPAGLCHVFTEDGRHVGWADYNPVAPVPARLLTCEAEWPGEEELIALRLLRSMQRRLRQGYSFQAGASRLVNSEGDGLPGLVIDCYARTMVVDFITRGMRERKDMIERVLAEHFADAQRVYRMSVDAAQREGLKPLDPADVTVSFAEHGILYQIAIGASQKTAFYLDQRENRRLVAHYAQGRRVLDLFSYQGAFSLNALAAGAVASLAVDSSDEALTAARRHAEANNFGLSTVTADVFDIIDDLTSEGPFDLVICDPPKLAPRRQDKRKALGAYRHLADRRVRLLSDSGLLLFCSCCQAVQEEDLRTLLAQVARRQRVELDVIATLGQPADHPWPVCFPTARYLSSILIEKRPCLASPSGRPMVDPDPSRD
jgi:23S rRNA (cytosine1962-C5)-methyltransferase